MQSSCVVVFEKDGMEKRHMHITAGVCLSRRDVTTGKRLIGFDMAYMRLSTCYIVISVSRFVVVFSPECSVISF